MSTPARFRLRLLGAGGAFSRRYGTTCSLLSLPSGEQWLIDCGRQAPDQLARAGLSWHDISGQLVTHVHGDHVYGMEDFAFSRFYFGKEAEAADGDQIAAICGGGAKPRLIAHTSVLAELWQVLAPSLRYLDGPDGPDGGTLDHYFGVVSPTLQAGRGRGAWPAHEVYAHDRLRVATRESEHIPGKPCFGLLMGLDGIADVGLAASRSRMWWSGDGLIDAEWMVSVVDELTIIFQDCSFGPVPTGVHAHIDDIAGLPAAVREKMVIMHHDDDVEIHRAQVEDLGLRLALPDDEFDLHTGARVEVDCPAPTDSASGPGTLKLGS